MKRKVTFTLLLTVIFALPLLAQNYERTDQSAMNSLTGLSETRDISDFTIVDSDGQTWNLYEQLEAGKTVVLDLFFTT